MKSAFTRFINFLSNPSYGSIFSGIVFFFIMYFNSKDWKYALQFTIFVAGMYLFNFFVCNYYRVLKANRFNFKAAATPKSWMYFALHVGGTVVVFLIFLPKIFWLYGGIMSGCLLSGLFIYDLIKNGLR